MSLDPRQSSPSGSGVASLIVAKLRLLRGQDIDLVGNTAFIIDSLKNPAEVEMLDQIYGRNFYTVSVYQSKEARIVNLTNRIAKDRSEPPGETHRALALELVNDDEKGVGSRSQNVRETFPKADFFVNQRADVSAQIKRLIELVFGEPFSTPTNEEYFMFMAKASGYRSADLSRQVGAVIVDRHGSLASTGCNEVPYPGGGIYSEGCQGSIDDNRDFVKQYDPNYMEIKRSLIELVEILKGADMMRGSEESAAIVESLLQGRHKEIMSNARVRNLIEFGRIVHAEMHAICEAAASGRVVRGGSLYCTTFPCHGCARHIIACGIKEVIYIEPYPKSLTLHLYEDEVRYVHDEQDAARDAGGHRVLFRPFHGISPTLYQRVFRYRPRKDGSGNVAKWDPGTAVPSAAAFGVERPKLEAAATEPLASVIENAKLLFNKRSR